MESKSFNWGQFLHNNKWYRQLKTMVDFLSVRADRKIIMQYVIIVKFVTKAQF